jgi:hypothetical protein
MSSSRVTVEIVGDPSRLIAAVKSVAIVGDPAAAAAAVGRALEGVDRDAGDELVERMEREPRLLRRFGDVDIRRAPRILGMIGRRASSYRLPVVRRLASRPREHRARRTSRTSSSPGSPRSGDPSEPPDVDAARCGGSFVLVRRRRA